MRPALLFSLAAAACTVAACASWRPGVSAEQSSTVALSDEPTRAREPLCATAPDVRQVGASIVIADACATHVALYRRDVVAGDRAEFVAVCVVPCVDAAVEVGGVYAYTTAAVVLTADGIVAGGASPEAYAALAEQQPTP